MTERLPLHSLRREYLPAFVVKTDPKENMTLAVRNEHDVVAPRVSIVITCHNQGEYLQESVGSAMLAIKYLMHDYKKDGSINDYGEIIIVDDCSDDSTGEIGEQLASGIVSYVRTPSRLGQPALARNYGAERARGINLLFIDADDRIEANFLDKLLKVMEEESAEIGYCDRQDFGGEKRLVKARPLDTSILPRANHLSYCSVMRREVWETTGGYRDNVPGMEDWDFWINAICVRGFKAAYLPEPLFCYRVGSGTMNKLAQRNYRQNFAHIVLNNPSVYTQDEVLRAQSIVRASLPLISVVIATKDRLGFLWRAIESVLAQDHPRVQLVVVNDGGMNVAEQCAALAPQASHVFTQENRGRGNARNLALTLCNGDYVAFLDDDDYWYPTHLSTLLRGIQASGKGLVYSTPVYVTEVALKSMYVVAGMSTPLTQEYDAALLKERNYIASNSFLVEKSLLDKAGRFDAELQTHEDWDLLIRIAKLTDFEYIKDVTCAVSWRHDGSSTSSSIGNDENLGFEATKKVIHERYA